MSNNTITFSDSKDPIYTIPKLNPKGTNWIVYKTRLTVAFSVRKLIGHLDGMDVMLAHPLPNVDIKTAMLTEAQEKLHHAWLVCFQAWMDKENIARQALVMTLDNPTLMKVHQKGSVAAMWAAITKVYEDKTKVVISDMKMCMHQLKCAENGDLQTHFDKLQTLYEQLA
ncbi:hypothetical protein JAAARDRAFT_128187, partial [Jaapia argillacea MUCL 33604]